MSLRVEIETWVRALEAYDRGDFSASLDEFSQMDHTARIAFNIGVIYATLGSHDEAIGAYARAVGRDRYLAVAYFQAGVSQFLLGRFEAAHRSFSDALLHLRGNNYIDYDQLGLHFKLYACECLFNRGLCAVYLQQRDIGLKEITSARNCKVVKEHDVIDEAIRESAEG
ncbi:NADPH oxidase regulator NoxR, partial [Piedraia hortae CBS 480.64]